ncbi:MAG: sulfur oxidation c-type cytochrome SoxA [bacterium]
MSAGRTLLATAVMHQSNLNSMRPAILSIPNMTATTAYLCRGLLFSALILMVPLDSFAVPTSEEIREDIRQFQKFFFSRFPEIPLEAYQDGVNALPQYASKRLSWELLMEFPPYETEMISAREQWLETLPSGGSLKQCFAGKPPPTAYPYFFDGEVHTIVGDINSCLVQNGAQELSGMSGQMARLAAAFKSPWSGQTLDVDFRSEEIRRLYQKGRQYFWAKRGQMNLSCANCHVHNAGNQLRGDVLSAALGHTTGYPAYSTRWSTEGEPLGTLHRRYAQCNALVGAAPHATQSEEYIALEIYQAIMSAGIPLKVPSQRQ